MEPLHGADSLGRANITSQPQSLAVNPGSNATFSVTATGNGPLAYQWRFNGTNLTDASATSYTRTNAQLIDAGSYSVLVSDSNGTTLSLDALLTINTPPIITNQPQDQVVWVGQTATFSVGVSGTEPFSYQWQFQGYPLPEATNSSYAQTNARSIDVGAYSVVVSNVLGLRRSAPMRRLILVQDSALGDDTFGQGSAFVGSTNLIAVAAGAWHNLGLRADGTVVAWGNNSSQQAKVAGRLAGLRWPLPPAATIAWRSGPTGPWSPGGRTITARRRCRRA